LRELIIMENESQKIAVEPDYSLPKARGVGNILLILFLAVWVIAFSGVDLFVRWSFEQSMFESEVGITDGRWLVHLIYGVVVFIPLLALYFAIKVPRIKLMLRLWLIGGLFVFLSVPAKTMYLTAQSQSYILLTLALALMIILFLLLEKGKRNERDRLPRSSMTGTAALAGVGLATPWVLWGAFGSVLDLLVVIVFGLLFAIFVIKSVFPYYLEKTQPVGREVSRGEYLFDGFVLAVFLLIMVTGLSQNCSQLLLALTIPPAGWLIAGLATGGRKRKDQGKMAVGVVSALVLILPLAFFDTDELALVINGTTTGEVVYWAQRAGWYSFIFMVTIAVVIFFAFRVIEKANTDKRVNLGLIALSALEFFALYFFAGQPGFFGDRLFVIMKDQVEMSQVDMDQPLNERKQQLYTLLTGTASNSQMDLQQKLKKRGISYTPYYLVNGMEVNAGWFMKGMLTGSEGVDRVLESPRLRPLPQPVTTVEGEVQVPPDGTLWNLEMIHVAQVHEILGVTGEGIVIGQTDSGVDASHPELKQSYRGRGASNDYNWLDPWNGTVSPVDTSGHGTGTTGIIVGETRGIAPDAEWIGCVNLARNLGNPALYLDCMQFMFAPYPQGGDPFEHGNTAKGAMIINNSWGCPKVEGCDPAVFEQAMSVLKSAGIFMSVAAGNNGYYGCATITDPPAIYKNAFTVGAVNKTGELSAFSSRGPVEVDGSGRAKPDLLAPGEQILVASPGGTYTFSSGTSFSAPHVSGVVALMWSANPALIGDIDMTTRILRETAQPFTGRESECGGIANESGAGILDAYAAVQAALAAK